MPYNPQITNQVGEILSRGIEQGKSRLFEALQWAAGQADETKSLRSQLDTIDPEGKDAHKDMSKGELQGKLLGLHAQDQAKQSALDTALKQSQINQANQAQMNEGAMGKALTAAVPPVTSTATDLRGMPAAGGNPFTVNVPSQGQMTPGALMKAIAQNPGAINSPAGRQALNDWIRAQGQQSVAQTRAATLPTPIDPGASPTMSQDGRFFLNTHTRSWEPAPAGSRTGPPPDPVLSKDKKLFWDGQRWQKFSSKESLFGGSDGGESDGAVSYTWKDGQLQRAAQ